MFFGQDQRACAASLGDLVLLLFRRRQCYWLFLSLELDEELWGEASLSKELLTDDNLLRGDYHFVLA